MPEYCRSCGLPEAETARERAHKDYCSSRDIRFEVRVAGYGVCTGIRIAHGWRAALKSIRHALGYGDVRVLDAWHRRRGEGRFLDDIGGHQ